MHVGGCAGVGQVACAGHVVTEERGFDGQVRSRCGAAAHADGERRFARCATHGGQGGCADGRHQDHRVRSVAINRYGAGLIRYLASERDGVLARSEGQGGRGGHRQDQGNTLHGGTPH